MRKVLLMVLDELSVLKNTNLLQGQVGARCLRRNEIVEQKPWQANCYTASARESLVSTPPSLVRHEQPNDCGH